MTHSVCEGWAGEDAWKSLRAAELSHCTGKGMLQLGSTGSHSKWGAEGKERR